MQLHGTARHCRLLCQRLRALKSRATLTPSPPHSRRVMPGHVRARMGRAWHVFVKSKKTAMFRVLRKHPFISRRCPPLSRGEYNRAYIVVKLLFTSHCTGVPLSFTTHFLTYDGDCTQRTLDGERRYIDSRTVLSLRRLVLQRAPETELPARNPRPTPLQTVKLTCRSCRCSCGST